MSEVEHQGLEIDQIVTEQLIPYARNARTHGAEQVTQLAEFGFVNPVLNDKLGDDFQAFLTDACENMLKVTKGGLY